MRWPCSEQSTEFSDMVRVRPLTLNRLVSEEGVFVVLVESLQGECHYYVFKERGRRYVFDFDTEEHQTELVSRV